MIECGDCREVLRESPADSFDSVVTDPPYELGFMGKSWDSSGVAFDPATWAAVLRVLKPGGYMLAMGGTRTYHRLAVAVEDAGFEIRDCLMWMYGTGFPKGQGCLKPAWEPILLCRKPGKRVLPLGVDACRVGTTKDVPASLPKGDALKGWGERPGRKGKQLTDDAFDPNLGRWPANVLHDGSDEVLEAFGDASRFFYCAKASKRERDAGLDGMPKTDKKLGNYRLVKCNPQTGKPNDTQPLANNHPTVKPLALMRWMVRLVTPEGGRVLDPFAGSGSTLVAATQEGREAFGVELDAGHCEIIRRRVREAMGTGLLVGVV